MKGLRPIKDQNTFLQKNDPRFWSNIAKIHYDHCSNKVPAKLKVHLTDIFLPWHRVYLYYFENICRDVLKENNKTGYETFALPYWDWVVSPVIPKIFHGNEINSWDEDLNSVEPPKEWDLKVNEKEWERTNSWEFKPPNVNLPNLVETTLKQDFFKLVGRDRSGLLRPYGGNLEVTHNLIHNAFCGNIHTTPTAALDPLFWLHHANVDWIWDQWLTTNGGSIPPPNWTKCVDYSNIKECKELGSQIKLRNECIFCKWLSTDVGLEYIDKDGKVGTCRKKVSEVIRISDLDYRYSCSKEIIFGESLNVKVTDEKDYSITIFDGSREAKVGGVIKVNVADIEFPKDSPELSNIQNSINSIFEAKLNDISTSRLPSLLLDIEIEKPENPEIAFTIFINPDSEEPLANDKSYVFTISFFESAGHDHSKEGEAGKDDKRQYLLDITSNILKFNSFDLKSATISIRPMVLNDCQNDVSGNIKLLNLGFSIAQYPTSDPDK
jgi:hypothetical protein